MEDRARPGLLSPDEWLLCGAVLSLSGVLNGQLPAPLRIPANLAGCGLVGLLARRGGAGVREMGVDESDLNRGIVTGLAVGVPLSAIFVGGAVLPATRSLYGVSQITEASTGRALYEAFIRIPFGTALPEEFIFRGALLAALSRNHSPAFSLAVSSVLFGLWHVGPALRQSGARGYRLSSTHHRVLHAGVSVAATALAGVGLALLRQRTRSISAPWVVHAAVNGSGYLAGWLALRTRGPADVGAPQL